MKLGKTQLFSPEQEIMEDIGSKMKFLLVAINSKYIHSNPAVYSLKSWADNMPDANAGDIIEIAEYTINQPPDGIMADIYCRKADVLFVSCYIWNIRQTADLIENISRAAPALDIWLGGPEVSFHVESTMHNLPPARGIIFGEGEQTFGRVVTAYSRLGTADAIEKYAEFKNINGIAFRDCTGNIIVNQGNDILDMNRLPFPYEHIEDFSNRIIYYESSRGCPFRCAYCLSSVEKRLRLRDTEKVKSEIEIFMSKKVPQVKFTDRTFNCDHRHAMEIWRFIKENDNGVTNFHFEVAADLLTDSELDFLAALRPGQIQLEAGIQSTNPETLKAINRKTDMERLKNAVSRIHSAGNIHIHLDLIAGLPYEDAASFARSFDEVYGMSPDQLQLGFLKVLKGTPMESCCREYGIVYRSSPPYEVIATKWISYEELLQLKGVEEMVEVYYNSGQFDLSLKVLSDSYRSPFQMFEELAEWYRSREPDMVNVSRNRRYEIFLEFAKARLDKTSADDFEWALICDYYMRDNVKNRPGFFRESSTDKTFAAEFYRREAEERRYLENKMYDGKDIRFLRKTTHLEKFPEGYRLFDYSERNPMNNNAAVISIDSERYEKYN